MKIKTRYKVVGWFVLFSFCCFALVIFLTNYFIKDLTKGTSETNELDFLNSIGYILIASVIILYIMFLFIVSITIISIVSYFISRAKGLIEYQKGFTITTVSCFALLILYSTYWFMSYFFIKHLYEKNN